MSDGGGLIGVKKFERESGECRYAKGMEITIVVSIEKVAYLVLPAKAPHAHGCVIL